VRVCAESYRSSCEDGWVAYYIYVGDMMMQFRLKYYYLSACTFFKSKQFFLPYFYDAYSRALLQPKMYV